MTEQVDGGRSRVTDRLDRRTVLKGIGAVPLVGGGIALSSTVSGDDHDGATESNPDDGPQSTTDAREGAAGEDETESAIRALECEEVVTAEFTDDDPRTPTGDDAPEGVPPDSRYHEYRFEGYADEWVYFTMATEAYPNPDYEGIGDDPFYYAGDPALYLFDGDERIGYDPEAGYWGAAHVSARLPADGTYRLIATGAFSRDPAFEYELYTNCTYRTPVTDRPPEPIPIECGETIAGEFTDDSVRSRNTPSIAYDVYTFEGRCGDCVTITTRSDEEPSQPRPMLFDPDGRYDGPRYGADGTYAPGAESTYTGEEFVLSEYRLPKTGSYTIWLSSYGPTYYEYELSLEC
ncbi:hypothetical protein [Natrononativus amylolyticus]|uniref:hypothetical protein n=1 Tax=Natrononativus amylolyticus TaxID=2963434 RepID=UPI0020CEF59A|nr:hypothetical protein [Natrononativus amylolyticus]